MDSLLEYISNIILNSVWLAPILAFLAGILTSFTPCSISSVPLIISYVSGTSKDDTKKAFLLSLIFAVGSAITFTSLGIIATLAGTLIGNSSSIWYIFLGILMLLMALQTWELYEIIPSSYLLSKNTKKGYLGALIAGILAGVFSSPCSTPVLITLLAVVAKQGNLFYGVLLLLLYSIGHGILAVICGTSIGFVNKLKSDEKYNTISKILKFVIGFIMSLIGFYMFYLAF